MPQKLKQFRKNSGYTIEEVGEKLNKTKSAVSTWENGKAIPDVNTLLRLCALYNIADFNEFLDTATPVEYSTLTRNERKIITLYRKSSPTVKKSIENLLRECNK